MYNKSKKLKKTRRTNIGGQAVLEGVMMRGNSSMATAVRNPNGDIEIESSRFTPISEKNVLYRIPFIRGILNFFSMMYLGVGIMMRAGAVFDDESAEPTKFEKWVAKKTKASPLKIAMAIGVVIGILFAVALFVILPNVITQYGFSPLLKNLNGAQLSLVKSLIEGAIRITIFIIYLLLVSRLKDIRRVFMYHGAEHKTISCYEHELEMTVENVQKMTTIHDRCGTTFIFIVMIVGIILVALTGWHEKTYIRLLIRLALLPVVMGVSYEILKFLAKYDNWFVDILKFPGLMLQKLTTRQPDDEMVECAIAAFNRVLLMDGDSSVEESRFNTKNPYNDVRKKLEEKYEVDSSDMDWIISYNLNVPRSNLKDINYVYENDLLNVEKMLEKRSKGVPLQHIFKNADFYGNIVDVNPRVLCPRPETEEVVHEAIDIIKKNSITNVLDLCTGSGVIAITLKKEIENICADASDYSEYALEVAKNNARKNDVLINFINSNYLDDIDDKYELIVSNPPYIKTSDIDSLDVEVRDYDPHLALDGGKGGVDAYLRILKGIKKLTKLKYIIFEIGYNQRDLINQIYSGYEVMFKKDVNGNDRIAIVKVR